MIRLFVLLTWHPAIGLPVDPVGVLGIEQSSGGSCRHHVCWLTPGSRTNAGWISRLAAPPDEAAVIRWLDQEGAHRLAEISVPGGKHDLEHAVEGAARVLMAEVIPLPREAG